MLCLSRVKHFFILPKVWTKNNTSTVLRSKISTRANSLKSEYYSTASLHLTEADKQTANLIVANTVKHQSLMVPELLLYLITPSTPLWKAPYDDGKTFENDPFW